jgi:flagellum-specific ATP synthase
MIPNITVPSAGTVCAAALAEVPSYSRSGRVSGVVGLLIEAIGLHRAVAVGDRCAVIDRQGERRLAEVVGFKSNSARLMAYGSVDGIGPGCAVEVDGGRAVIRPDRRWLGRVVDAFGDAADGSGPLPAGAHAYPLRRRAVPAQRRARIGARLDVGVRAINAFATLCLGQRVGVFSGSGVGKSTLMSMIARNTTADVNVIGLIGERGREAREFIEDVLGADGLKRSVVVVATSDEAAPVRRQAAYVTMAMAEYFRDHGASVLCLMDSVTRFAMAQREIGLAAGEPPASRGYTPSVFAELPRLLERAGPGEPGQGSITGLFTVLVEGDDMNEPVADAVRSILDGHILLDRAIAERGRYPAVDVLASISRTMPGCATAEENAAVGEARRVLALHASMAELIRLGAYRPGSDAEVDRAIRLEPALEAFLAQAHDDKGPTGDVYAQLGAILAADTDTRAAAVAGGGGGA